MVCKLQVCKLVLIEFDIQCQFDHFKHEMIHALSIKVQYNFCIAHEEYDKDNLYCTCADLYQYNVS